MASNKRKAGSETQKNKQNALAAIDRLSDEEKTGVLRELVQNSSVEATNLLVKKQKILDTTPCSDELLKDFGSRAYAALHQLDRLRPSQQFTLSGQVSSSLSDLLKDTQRYPPLVRLSCLARIAGVYSHAPEETGEVFKNVSCSGFTSDLCRRMTEALGEVTGIAGEVTLQLKKVLEQLERVDGRLSDYGLDEFEEVVNDLKSKVGTCG